MVERFYSFEQFILLHYFLAPRKARNSHGGRKNAFEKNKKIYFFVFLFAPRVPSGFGGGLAGAARKVGAAGLEAANERRQGQHFVVLAEVESCPLPFLAKVQAAKSPKRKGALRHQKMTKEIFWCYLIKRAYRLSFLLPAWRGLADAKQKTIFSAFLPFRVKKGKEKRVQH